MNLISNLKLIKTITGTRFMRFSFNYDLMNDRLILYDLYLFYAWEKRTRESLNCFPIDARPKLI